ncbi:MAG TPA: aldo/keto reductase [Candidatus Nanopelagicales bacterium]|nr:aldo/keto reductase [Candidatus Nanopelagicales bacterium]
MSSLAFSTFGSIPAVGLGTWPMDDDEAARVVPQAIGLGYRLVDTAYAYGNERGVGRGIAASGIARDELFVTTKFNKEWHSVQGVRETTEASLERLGLDRLDLLLVHWPNPAHDRYVEAWEGCIAVRDAGLVSHIGVSNFLPEHVERIVAATGVAPELDQLQINPRWTQPVARAYNAEHGIITQAWRPLGMGGDLLRLPLVTELAATYTVTPAQLLIAWCVALGLSTTPKSSDPVRQAQNLAAAEIDLDPADVAALCALDGTEPDVTSPLTFGH